MDGAWSTAWRPSGRIACARGATTVKLRVDTTKRNAPARTFLEAISPAEARRPTAESMECVLPAASLARLRFEPADAVGPPPTENETGAPEAARGLAGNARSRERQIARTAYELSTMATLCAAIDGPGDAGTSPPAMTGNAVGKVVYPIFAGALRMPVSRVKDCNRLDALGCDSFKIVEITVQLLRKFPWLPSTVLFELRSVTAIVHHIAELAAAEQVARSPEPKAAERGNGQAVVADIAVVGISVRCAGVESVDDLWQLLSTGASSVRLVPPDRRFFLNELHDDRRHWAGLLDDAAGFDAELFGVSPREAAFMDPQQRLFLEVAWGALEDAGGVGTNADAATGVFVGLMYSDYVYRANLVATATQGPYRCWEGFISRIDSRRSSASTGRAWRLTRPAPRRARRCISPVERCARGIVQRRLLVVLTSSSTPTALC